MAIDQPHEVDTTLTQDVIYPAHEQRSVSSEFRRNRITLIRKLDVGCWICGSKEKREVHHIHEWSLWNALDKDKVLTTLHCFDPYGYTSHNPEEPIDSPDDIRNLLVLCGEHSNISGGHHRGKEIGVHTITFPIWIALRSATTDITNTQIK